MPMPHVANVRPPSARTGDPWVASNASSSASVVGTGSGRFHSTTVTMMASAAAADQRQAGGPSRR